MQADALLSVGPVAPGLDRLARQAGQAVVARPGDLAGRNAAALRGRMALSQALARWCRPVGLPCRRIAGGIVVRAEAPRPRPIPAVAQRVVFPPPPAPVIGPDVIVTGRGGTTVQGELERSYSASHLDVITLARRPPQSLAELLSGLPGLWVDTSADAAANTIRVRDIPLDGYQAIAVPVDGLPVQHDTLPWTDIDQFVRPNLMIETIDYVRGGPSAIFASNAPGGALNLRTQAPGDRPGGAVRVRTTDYGLARWEGYATAPIAPGWRMIAVGMIASDPTVRQIAERWRIDWGLRHERALLSAQIERAMAVIPARWPMVASSSARAGGTIAANASHAPPPRSRSTGGQVWRPASSRA